MPRRSDAIARCRAQVGQWASEHHPDTLTHLMAAYLGPDRRTVRMHPELVEQALSFALIAATPEGDTLVQRYKALGLSHPRRVRDALTTFAEARFTLLRVNGVERDRGLAVRDVVADELLFLREVSATHSARPGMWLLAGIGRVEGAWELLGDARVLAKAAPIRVVQELLRPQQPELRAIEAWHRSLRRPRLVTSDGDPLVLLELLVDRSWPEVVAEAAAWGDTNLEDEVLHVLGEPVPRAGRPVRASLRHQAGRVAIQVHSLAREREILARLGHPEVLQRVDRSAELPPQDPEGEAAIAEGYQMELPEGEGDMAWFEAQRAAAWPDEPIPALDGLTPRQALAAGRAPEVRAVAPDAPEVLSALGLAP